MSRMSIANQLNYQVPQIKLALIREPESNIPMFTIQNQDDVERFFSPLRYAAEEYMVSLHLNARYQVIGIHEVSHGTVSASLVHPREVFKAAVLSNAFALIVAHNHPAGSLTPSQEDLLITRQLSKAGSIMGISLLDHLIITSSSSYSIRQDHPKLFDSK